MNGLRLNRGDWLPKSTFPALARWL